MEAGRAPRSAFGHFGIGGSGGIANPHLGLSIGFVTNHLGNHAMSLGDARLPMLAAIAERATRSAIGESATDTPESRRKHRLIRHCAPQPAGFGGASPSERIRWPISLRYSLAGSVVWEPRWPRTSSETRPCR
jgi:hypothetical protein